MSTKRHRYGVGRMPANTILGNNNTNLGHPAGEPPFAMSASEVAGILASNSVVSVANSFTFDPNLHNLLMVRSTSNSAITVTLPSDSAVGSNFSLVQSGSGQVTFVANTGATLQNDTAAFKTFAQWSVVSAFVESNIGANSANWVLAGSVTP